MNDLIQLSARHIGADSTQTVNARELHAFLGSCQDFSTWIKKRIADYGFSEGVDYVRIALEAGMRMAESGGPIGGIGQPQKNGAVESMGYGSFGQQGRIEYGISLDMAKELAMVERNDKGKQARQYFIECERRAKASALLISQSLPEALRLAADLADQKAKVDATLPLTAQR